MKKEEVSTEKLLQIIQEQNNKIKYLEEKLDYFMRQKFCSSSEKLLDGQLSLFNEDIEDDTEKDNQEEETIKVEYTRKKGGRKSPPKHLDRIRVEHDVLEEDKTCSCGCQRVVIKEIVTEQYDIVPAKFRVIQNVRFVYGCSSKCGAKLVTAPLTPQVLPQSQITPSFLATIAVQKFEDSLPLYRQAKIFKNRFGVAFTTTTLSNWIIKSSKLVLEPFIQRLNEYMLKSDYIHADETTLQVLKVPIDTDDPSKGNRKATKKSYIWLRATSNNDKHKIVLMNYSSTRASSTPQKLFKGFSGHLHTDGYAGYNIVSNKDDVTQLACWAHARRKFTDIIKSGVSTKSSKKLANEIVLLRNPPKTILPI
jgi:transposase